MENQLLKKNKKGKENPAIKVHKPEIEKLELKEKLKKEQAVSSALAISVLLIMLLVFLVVVS